MSNSFYVRMISVVLLVLICPSIGVAQTHTKRILPLQHWATSRGTPVYFVRVSVLPIIDIGVAFDAGSARDGAHHGLASLTNAMLDEGTTRRNADTIATDFSKVGALYSVDVNRDMAFVSLRSLTAKSHLTLAVDNFIEVLTQANFPRRPFLRMRKQTLRAIENQQENPLTIASKKMFYMLYGRHPYGHPMLGSIRSVSRLRRSDLQGFYREYYGAKNAMVVIVGNVTQDQARQLADKIVVNLHIGQKPPALPPVQPLHRPDIQAVSFPSTQKTIMLGAIGIKRSDPDFFPLMVGNYTLGGAPLLSRLYTQLRTRRGLVYFAASQFVPLREKGPFITMFQTRMDKAVQALQLTRQTLSNFVKVGPSPQEVTEAKQNIIGRFPQNFDSNRKIVAIVVMMAFYHLPLDYLDTYIDNIKAVSAETIRAAFTRHLQPRQMATAIVGKSDSEHRQ